MPASKTASTSPCGWCRKSRTATIVATTALLLFASNAQGEIVTFHVDSNLSWLKQTVKAVGPALGGSKTGSPQFPGSDTTHFYAAQ